MCVVGLRIRLPSEVLVVQLLIMMMLIFFLLYIKLEIECGIIVM